MKNGTTSRAEATGKSNRMEPFKRQCTKLQIEIVGLRASVESRENQIHALERLIAERNERIDALRYSNQKLGLENDCLTAILIAPMPAKN